MSVGGRAGVPAYFAWTLLLCLGTACKASEAEARPNILLIMTDDQGYGDLGIHGNPHLRTPNIDRFAQESVRLKSFFVSPVCSPTRASLMTGRYNYRTGVVDTYAGRSLMNPAETTIAEVLAASGYRTGIFGKWHLGDNAPMRPIDQGFQEALVIKGGGIGQASDPPGGTSYFDPILQHNGHPRRYQGYCSDIFTTAAIDFLGAGGDRPFFAYLAFNCPHDPLEAPPTELETYKSIELTPDELKNLEQPGPPSKYSPAESLTRIYAMITNIDANVGRILSALESHSLSRDTIVIFLTDNGPAKPRFNAGLRSLKGSVYDGGIHVPFYIRWPARFRPGRVVDRIAAHIDVMPTLLAACGVATPAGLRLDGRSLMPLLVGEAGVAWPDRMLFFQWHRGDRPEPDRAFAARTQRYKLLRTEAPLESRKIPPLELFDMEADPGEEHNIAREHSQIVERMHADYLDWFKDVSSTRGFDPVRIEVGGDRENPTILTRQDWRGPRAGWGPNDQGHWEVDVSHPGPFEVTLRLTPRRFRTVAHLTLRGVIRELDLAAGATECTFHNVLWAAGPGRLEAWVEGNRATAGPLDVTIRRTGTNP
ncbi:MAG: arylsulfatase [Isosphaeraceae bacterium]